MDRVIFPLPVLLFAVGGIHFGVSADQIISVAAHKAQKDDKARWFHQEMGYQAPPLYHSPAVISVWTATGDRLSVVIDAVEEIAWFGAGDIRPLPALVAARAGNLGPWGVIPRLGRMYLLVDFASGTRHAISKVESADVYSGSAS